MGSTTREPEAPLPFPIGRRDQTILGILLAATAFGLFWGAM
jgi:hypothetical protein